MNPLMNSLLRFFCVVFFILVASAAAQAGDYYNGAGIDTYDPVSGLYYKAITTDTKKEGLLSSSSSHRITNINIFDPADGSYRALFSQNVNGRISNVCFEYGFKDGSVLFNGDMQPCAAKNNQSLAKRDPKDKILAAVELPENKGIELFTADKHGKNLRRIVHVPPGASWHIDVRNSKLRVVNQVGQQIKLENFDW